MARTRISGRRWAVGSIERIPDLDDPEVVYLWRLRILQTPWFGLYLHKINIDDGDRPLHDHPWSYGTLILRGGYTEEALRPEYVGVIELDWKAGTWHRVKAPGPHAIRSLKRTPTWTFVVVGRRQREWGFLTPEGWMHYKDLLKNAGDPRHAEHP